MVRSLRIVADVWMKASYNYQVVDYCTEEIVADVWMKASYNETKGWNAQKVIVADVWMKASYNPYLTIQYSLQL